MYRCVYGCNIFIWWFCLYNCVLSIIIGGYTSGVFMVWGQGVPDLELLKNVR